MDRFTIIPFAYLGFLLGPLGLLSNAECGVVLIMFSALCFVVATVLSFHLRPCRHGFVTQGRFFIFCPYAVRECPKCGDYLGDG